MNLSRYVASSEIIKNSKISGRAKNAVGCFLAQIQNIEKQLANKPLKEQFELVIKESKLIQFLEKKKTEQAATKIDNIMELINAAHGYRPLLDEDEMHNPDLEMRKCSMLTGFRLFFDYF